MDLQGVGIRIKALREELGLKQADLANNLKVHQTQISEIEGGKRKPSFETLFFLSDNCNVSIDKILRGDNFIDSGIAVNENVDLQTKAAKEAMDSLNKCAKSIKKLDMSAVLGIKYYENELKRVDNDPETENALQMVKTEMMERMAAN